VKRKHARRNRRITPLGATTASSSDDGSRSAAKAVDGSAGTRWSSAYADRQWWKTDLGRVRRISAVQVNWESAFASRYAIDVSRDGRHWRTVARPKRSKPGLATTRFHTRSARCVRIRGIKRATRFGISFWEARVLRATH
jgi:hypothetical protein